MSSLLGLNIGHQRIKAVQLEARGDDRYVLQAIGKVEAPPKGIESEAAADKKAVVEAIKTLLAEANIKSKDVVASLPDAKIFTRLVSFPLLTDEELSSSIQWEADQYIPIPLDKVQLHWQVIEKQKPGQGAKMEVLLVAVPKHFVNQVVTILNETGLTIKALETESMALSRSLIGQSPKAATTLIISFGHSSTDLSIVRKGMVVLTRSIATGEAAMTRAVVDALHFDAGQADAYKNAYGILKDKLDGKLAEALSPVIEVILSEIKRAAAFYHEQRPDDRIKRAALTGGPANMPGLVVFLARELGYEVVIGDPWSRVEVDPAIAEGVRKEAVEYAVAVGLAMRQT